MTPHELIKSFQKPYDRLKDKDMIILISAGNFKTIKLLANFAPWNVLNAQKRKVYGDEIPNPSYLFCLNRALKLYIYSWPAACAWTRLRWKLYPQS